MRSAMGVSGPSPACIQSAQAALLSRAWGPHFPGSAQERHRRAGAKPPGTGLQEGSIPVLAAHGPRLTLARRSLHALPHQLYFQKGPSKEERERRHQCRQPKSVHSSSSPHSPYTTEGKKYKNQQAARPGSDEQLKLQARGRQERMGRLLGEGTQTGTQTGTSDGEGRLLQQPRAPPAKRQWAAHRHRGVFIWLCLERNKQKMVAKRPAQILFCCVSSTARKLADLKPVPLGGRGGLRALKCFRANC